MLVRFVKKSRLVALINNLDLHELEEKEGKYTHKEICEYIVHDIKHGTNSLPRYSSHSSYELYLVYLHLTYLYLNDKLIYENAESDLDGFINHIKKLPFNEAPCLDQDEFLQAYQLHMATNDYAGRYYFVTQASDTAEELNQYIDQLCLHYPSLSRELTEAEVRKLTGINRLFITLYYAQKRDELILQVVRPSDITEVNTPAFYAHSKGSKKSDVIIIPPVKLLKWIAQQTALNKKITLEPIFGKINEKTLYALHKDYKHPVSLHSKFIASNLISVHSIQDCSSFSITLHDELFHYMALSLYPENVFLFILNMLIPAAKSLEKNASEKERKVLYKIQNYLNDFATDSSLKSIENMLPMQRLVTYTCDMMPTDENESGYFFHLFLKLASLLLTMSTTIQEQYQIDMDSYIRAVLNASTSTNLSAYISQLISINAQKSYHIFNTLHLLHHYQLLDDATQALLINHAENAEFIYMAISELRIANAALFKNRQVIRDIITHVKDDKLSILIKELMNLHIELPDVFYKLIIIHISKPFTIANIIHINREYSDILAYPALVEFSLCHTTQVEKVFPALVNTDEVPVYLPLLSSESAISLLKNYTVIDSVSLKALLSYGSEYNFDYTVVLTALSDLFSISAALIKPPIINRVLELLSPVKIKEMTGLCLDLAAARPPKAPTLFDADDIITMINKTIRAICENRTLSKKTFNNIQKTAAWKILDAHPEFAQGLDEKSIQMASPSNNRR